MISRLYSYRLFLVAIALIVFGSLRVPAEAQSYLTPSGTGPSGNTVPVAQPLNGSTSTQFKAGSLLLGPNGGTAKFCLNADSTSDTGRCIDSWDDVANATGGPYLHYETSTTYPSMVSGVNPSNYTSQPGFTRVKASCVGGSCVDGSRQYYSYLTAASATLNGAYGLYATDGGSTSNYAGYFSGRLHIYQTIPGGSLGQLCLNGLTPNTECIDQWTDVSTGGGSYLQLQTANPPTPNTGSISISGTGTFGSIVIDTPQATLSRNITCGDGMCTAVNGEDQNTCPLDCAPIAAPLLANVTPSTGGNFCTGDLNLSCASTTTCSSAGKGTCVTYTGQLNISTPTTQLPAGSQVNMVLLRSTSATPSFVPLQGSTYTTGSIFGDTTVLYSGKLNQGLVNALVGRDRVTASGTYYYRAYLGNLYPRYGTIYTPSSNATVTYYRVLVSKTGNGGTPQSQSPDEQIHCGSVTGAFCTAYYPAGTVVTLNAEIVLSGYSFNGWIGCTEPRAASEPLCTVTLNANTNVIATYTTGSGGGGGGPGFSD